MTVPRRRAKGGNERLRNAFASTGARSGDGRTGEARPVVKKPQPPIYQPATTANVVTGLQADDTGTSITSTLAGAGSSNANGPNGIAIGPDSFALEDDIAIGHFAQSEGGNSLAIGYNSFASGDNSVALGDNADAGAYNKNVAVGPAATANGNYTVALGPGANALANGAVAIGADHLGGFASTSTQDQIALGTANHITVIKGKLVIADASGGLHQIVVSTGGVLSTVAYP